MDVGLRAVKVCVRHLHEEAEIDEPILAYIQQLIEQAVQDGDWTELRECLEAYFPGQPPPEVDRAVENITARFAGTGNTGEAASTAQEFFSNSGKNAASSSFPSSKAGATSAVSKTSQAFFFAEAGDGLDCGGAHGAPSASDVLDQSIKPTSSSATPPSAPAVLDESVNPTSSSATPPSAPAVLNQAINSTSSSAPVVLTQLSANSAGRASSATPGRGSVTLSLNPNALAFIPTQCTPPSGAAPQATTAPKRQYLLPTSVPGSVDGSDHHQSSTHHPHNHQPFSDHPTQPQSTTDYGADHMQHQSYAHGPPQHHPTSGLGLPGRSKHMTSTASAPSTGMGASEREYGAAGVDSGGRAAGNNASADGEFDWGFIAGDELQDGVGRGNDAGVLEWDMSAQETEAQFLQDAGWGWDAANDCTGDQALAILLFWFPSYSVQVLTDVLEANHGSLAKTYAELSTLEFDITNAGHPIVPPSSTPSYSDDAHVSHPSNPLLSSTPPSLDENHFPSLSAASPPAAHGTPPLYSKSWGAPSGAAKSFAGAVQRMPSRSPPTISSIPSSAPKAHSRPHKSSSKDVSVNVPWVSTGEEVAAQYAAAREEARDHARLRNMCFQQATLAFLSGDKALAKELSTRGRQHSDLMKECHARASQGIFKARNAHLGGTMLGPRSGREGGHGSGARSGLANFVDLHGIHASEARDMLDEVLGERKQGRKGAGSQQTLLVCVGTGHHTKVQHARLPQAVEAYLKEKKFDYSYAQPGLIRVVL